MECRLSQAEILQFGVLNNMKKYFENDINYKRFDGVINSWIGTPYKHLTVVKGRGADCALFICGILKDIGIINKIVFDYYPHDWFIHTDKDYVSDGFIDHIKNYAKSNIELEKYTPEVKLYRGDILGIAINSKVINHAAYYMEGNFLIHSLDRVGVHKVTTPEFFKERIVNIFRLMEK